MKVNEKDNAEGGLCQGLQLQKRSTKTVIRTKTKGHEYEQRLQI